MHKVLKDDPPWPSVLNVHVSPRIDAVVKRAMAKRPEDRFQSAAEFRRALDAALSAPVADDDATVVSLDDGDATVRSSTPDATLQTARMPAPPAVEPAPPSQPAPATPRTTAETASPATPPVTARRNPMLIAAGVAVLLDRVTALLDHLVEHRQDLRIIELDALVDLALLDRGQNQPDDRETRLVAALHGGLHRVGDLLLQHGGGERYQ